MDQVSAVAVVTWHTVSSMKKGSCHVDKSKHDGCFTRGVLKLWMICLPKSVHATNLFYQSNLIHSAIWWCSLSDRWCQQVNKSQSMYWHSFNWRISISLQLSLILFNFKNKQTLLYPCIIQAMFSTTSKTVAFAAYQPCHSATHQWLLVLRIICHVFLVVLYW